LEIAGETKDWGGMANFLPELEKQFEQFSMYIMQSEKNKEGDESCIH
jgi:hypothetical protein